MATAAVVGYNFRVMGGLEEILIGRARKAPITFAEFMEAALYDEEWGYYARGPEKVGPDGDYVTSPTMSPVYGMTIARLAMKIDNILGGPDPFTIVEPGAGTGHTAAQIIESVRKHRPEMSERMRYIAVERGKGRAQGLADKLAGEKSFQAVENIDSITPVRGMIFSNEFFDALPAHRMVMRTDGLKEIYVGQKDGKLADIEAEPSAPTLARWFEAEGITLREGQFADVSLDWPRRMEQFAGRLEQGAVVTVDYGYPAWELFSPQRARGSIMSYRGHRAGEDFYASPGERDLTAHVDFTALAAAGEKAGLKTLGLTDQLRMFLALGVHEVLAELEAEAGDFARFQALVQPAKALIMPGGMGETFKVLAQYRGLDDSQAEALKALVPPKYSIERPFQDS